MDWTERAKASSNIQGRWGGGGWGAIPWGGRGGVFWNKVDEQSTSLTNDSPGSTSWTKQEPD